MKILKSIGIILGVILLLLLIGSLIINSRPIPTYEKANFNFKHNSSPEAIIRGKKLTMMLCASCHTNRKTGKLTGDQMLDAPAEFGKIYSQNITQDKEFGIGNYTDAELVYLLRTGIKNNGQYSPPYMAKLPTMADDDINAIIAFLRSNDPMVIADNTPDKPCEPSFLTKVLSRIAFKPFPMPDKPISMPDTTNMVALGNYLGNNFECFSCHSADFKTNDFLSPPNSVGYYGGGNKPLNLQGKIMPTPNLTPHETGIKNWTKEEFIKAVKNGNGKDGKPLRYPMNPYSNLTDIEAGAIYDYLQTVQPINNLVEKSK
ncbi:MAG: c-type cytochrome [Bacteroidota bacterium]